MFDLSACKGTQAHTQRERLREVETEEARRIGDYSRYVQRKKVYFLDFSVRGAKNSEGYKNFSVLFFRFRYDKRGISKDV